MKRIIMVLAGALLAVPLITAAGPKGEINYTLDVKMKNIPDSVVFTLGCGDDPKYKLKVPIVNDSLHFELDIQEDFPVDLYVTARNPKDKNERFIQGFYAGKGIKQKMRANGEGFFVTAEVEGAPWDKATLEQQRYDQDYMKKGKAIQEERNKYFTMKQMLSVDTVELDSVSSARFEELTNDLKELNKARDKFIREWISANPDVPEAVSLMTWKYGEFSNDELKAFSAKVPASMMEMPKGKVLKKLVSTKRIAVGDKLADYDIIGVDADSVAIRLSQFTTPYILVDFNSLGCGACRMAAKKEIPVIIEKYADELTFVSFSVDESFKRMLKAHELDKATWPTIWDGEGSSGTICLKYEVTSYPTFFLFGPDRTLLESIKGWGPGMLDMWLKKYIKKK